MENSCTSRKCIFWDYEKKVCLDEIEYVNPDTGELVCKYWSGCILKEEYEMSVL